MCRNAILPTAVYAESLDSEVMNLIYVFNRWLNMLESYGKLDNDKLAEDFSLISKIVKKGPVDKTTKRALKYCRDYALAGVDKIEDLTKALRNALHLLCKAHEKPSMHKGMKLRNDQGMTEKYKPLSKRLAKEKIRKIGKSIWYTDKFTDDGKTSRLVRRFVEKRAAQMVYKLTPKRDVDSNSYRQAVRRAVSFSMFKKRHLEYNPQLRSHRSHWKVSKRKDVRTYLVPKRPFNSYEEALEACEMHKRNHPEDQIPITPYVCDYCGKWHIGHLRMDEIANQEESTGIKEAS